MLTIVFTNGQSFGTDSEIRVTKKAYVVDGTTIPKSLVKRIKVGRRAA